MSIRDKFILWGAAVLAAVLSALLTRWGLPIVIPPPPIVQPDPPRPGPPPEPQPNVPAAIARIQFGSAGCTTTIIGPRRGDGRYWCLTAAHCVGSVGQRGRMTTLDGRTLGVVVVALNRTSDACWLVTDSASESLPFALLAEDTPAAGSKVWHAGYGIDKPGNRESGTFVGGPDGNGQVRFRISVSPGDSGGGIVLDAQSRVLSCVCCTTNLGGVGDVWGAGPRAIAALRATAVLDEEWTPIQIPQRQPAPEEIGKKD